MVEDDEDDENSPDAPIPDLDTLVESDDDEPVVQSLPPEKLIYKLH